MYLFFPCSAQDESLKAITAEAVRCRLINAYCCSAVFQIASQEPRADLSEIVGNSSGLLEGHHPTITTKPHPCIRASIEAIRTPCVLPCNGLQTAILPAMCFCGRGSDCSLQASFLVFRPFHAEAPPVPDSDTAITDPGAAKTCKDAVMQYSSHVKPKRADRCASSQAPEAHARVTWTWRPRNGMSESALCRGTCAERCGSGFGR